MNAADLALLLQEANSAPWESVQSALDMVDGATHPRIGWLTTHLTQTKRAYWAAIAEATGCPPPPDDAGLRRLMDWEVEQTRQLSPEQLSTELTYTTLKNSLVIQTIFPNGVSKRKYGAERRGRDGGAFPTSLKKSSVPYYSEQTMTVAELLRLNARHSVWHAGQLAALAGRVRSA